MSQKTIYIDRLDTNKDIDFENLKKEALTLIQELSGKRWTDYNAHDPGITILEQLIYALTELVYLIDFDVKDFLAGEDGKIHYTDLALHEPLQIFPGETITSTDYCKLLFDTIKGVRNIWIPDSDTSTKIGTYHFLVDLANDVRDKHSDFTSSIKDYYCANRNLCEDIGDIRFLEREYFEIGGSIEVNNSTSAEEILAAIYFSCFKLVSPRMVFHSFMELKPEEIALEEYLTGPELIHGFIRDDEIPEMSSEVYVSELMKVVFQVQGVESIIDLYILKDGERYNSSLKFKKNRSAGYIKLPFNWKSLKISLLRNNRECTVNMEEVIRLFYNRYQGYKKIFNTKHDLSEMIKVPNGNHVKFDDYYSLQNHFPKIYGINEFGIPDSATPARKAQAKQLKGYLLVFEQIIVNFQSQMEHIKDLFSVQKDQKATYYTNAAREIPNIVHIINDEWKQNAESHKQDLRRIISGFDNFYDRKNKFLDFTLALYGETFSFHSFKHFNYYHAEADLPRVIFENKLLMLKNIVKINRYKAKSFNYLKPSWNTENVPMIKIKISLLLGIQDYRQIHYSDVLANYDLEFIYEEDVEKCANCSFSYSEFNDKLDGEYISKNFINVSGFTKPVFDDSILSQNIKDEIKHIENGYISEDFFRYGININCYKIGHLKKRNAYTLVFQHPESEKFIYISDFTDLEQGITSAYKLQQLLIKLNRESEGMHIVEHILLRSKNYRDEGIYTVTYFEEDIFVVSDELDGDINENRTKIANLLKDIHNYYIEAVDTNTNIVVIMQAGKKIAQGIHIFADLDLAKDGIQKYYEYFSHLTEEEINNKIRFNKQSNIEDAFFAHRITVVLPAWSARFHNKRFRDFVQESFALNLPAHIYPQFLWLDYQKMNAFENLYHDWLVAKQDDSSLVVDGLSKKLVSFLLRNQSSSPAN